MKPNRSKLRVEELERRENPTATNIGFNTPPNNVPPVEFIVAGYTLKQNNGNFATTSSAFGFQDATMTVAQAVTTANGGTVNAVLDDAFDGALSWGLALANGSVAPGAAPANGPLTYFDHDGIVDIVGAPLAPNKYGPGAIITGSPESTSFNGDSFNGLRLWQQNAVFSVNGAPVIRSVFFVGNPTGGTITQNLGVFSNLGSDTNTRIFDTGSGDFIFDPGVDRFVGSFQNYRGTTSTDPRLMFQLQGGFGHVQQVLDASSAFATSGNDQPHFNFFTTLAAGETKAFMTFTGLYASKQAAVNNNVAFASYGALQSSGLLAGLSSQTRNRIQNWDVGPLPEGEAIGTLAGVPSRVRTYAADGTPQLDFAPFDGFLGGVSVARGDMNRDGVQDIVAAAGQGAEPRVGVFNGLDGGEISSFFAYDVGYTGGVSVATGDVNGDGVADIVVGTLNGFSHVKVFSGADGAELASFFAFDGFTGGVNVASADVDGDGFDDIVVGTQSGSSHVKVFSGATGAELKSFIAFDAGYTGGISVAAGDLNGDSNADIVVGALQGVSHVKGFSGSDDSELASFFAYEGSLGGVSVAVNDADGDGRADIGTGSRVGSHVKAFRPSDLQVVDSFLSLEDGFPGGINLS